MSINQEEQLIQVGQKEFEEFYKNFGSDYFQKQSEIARSYGSAKIDILFKSVNFIIQVLGTIGIIAGFGFTAFSFVQNRLLFFLGEGILLFSIIYGITWVQKLYKKEFDGLHEAQNKHREYFSRRNKAFDLVYKQLLENKECKLSDFQEMQKINNEIIDIFKTPEEPLKAPDIYPKILYYLLIAGTIITLLSFFCCNFFGYQQSSREKYYRYFVPNIHTNF